MSVDRLEIVRDLLYRIEAALDDVDSDLAGGSDTTDTRQALWHLYRACADARTLSLEPLAISP